MGMNRGLWEPEKEVSNSWEESGELPGGCDLAQESRSMSPSFPGRKDTQAAALQPVTPLGSVRDPQDVWRRRRLERTGELRLTGSRTSAKEAGHH